MTSLLTEAYGALGTTGTLGGAYLVWRFNPRRMRRETAAAEATAEAEVQAEYDRQVAAETHAALWGTPALVDDAGAMIRKAQPGMLAEVRALRSEFPRNGKPARELLDEIADRQVAHQTELREHVLTADIVHNALWTAYLDWQGGPLPAGPPPAPPNPHHHDS